MSGFLIVAPLSVCVFCGDVFILSLVNMHCMFVMMFFFTFFVCVCVSASCVSVFFKISHVNVGQQGLIDIDCT